MFEEYNELVKECSEQGKALARMNASAGILEPLYLYGRKSKGDGRSGRLFLVRESAPVPDGVELITGEGLRGNIPYENYFQWVYDRAVRFPCLAYTAAAV